MSWHGHSDLATAIIRMYVAVAATTMSSAVLYALLDSGATDRCDHIGYTAAQIALRPLELIIIAAGLPVLALCRHSRWARPALWLWLIGACAAIMVATQPAIRT